MIQKYIEPFGYWTSLHLLFFSTLLCYQVHFDMEPHYHRELNPHAPKLHDTICGNDIVLNRDLNHSPYTQIR